MNCNQVREVLHPFADGELPPEEMEAVKAALLDYPDLQMELKELEATTLFAREAFMGPVADVDLSGVFDGVMGRIAQEDMAEAPATANRVAAGPSMWERVSTWFADIVRFEQPMQSLGAMAAVVLMVGGIYALTNSGVAPGITEPEAGPAAPSVAGGEEPGNVDGPRRRGMEQEQEMSRSGAKVESYEVAEGQLVIEGGEDDAPVVVWHVEESDDSDESTPAPAPGVQ